MSTTLHAQQPRWRTWRWVAVLGLGALVLGSAGKAVMRYEAASELRVAGFWPGRYDVGQVARRDWRMLFKRETWQIEREARWMGPGRTAPLRNLDALGPALRRLEIEDLQIIACSELQNVDALKDVPSLKTLKLSSCTSLQNVDGLQGLTALQRLDLGDCRRLENVDGLLGLTALQEIHLHGCTKLSHKSIAALEAGLPNAIILDPWFRIHSPTVTPPAQSDPAPD